MPLYQVLQKLVIYVDCPAYKSGDAGEGRKKVMGCNTRRYRLALLNRERARVHWVSHWRGTRKYGGGCPQELKRNIHSARHSPRQIQPLSARYKSY